MYQLLVCVGKGEKGHEDQASDATNDQAQHAAMNLHSLAPLARVEKGMSRDAPAAGHAFHVHADAIILARVWVTGVSEVLWPVVILHGASILH